MAKQDTHETPAKKPNRVLPIILGLILIGGAIFGVKEYIYYGKHVDTDDAQVDGDISPVVARVGGYVDSIFFEENTHVNKDQVLVKIDPRDYKIKLEQAQSAHPERFVDEHKPITIHRLRHTYATIKLRSGVSLPSVRKLLGHKNLQTTLRYTEIDLETIKRELVEARQRKR